MTKTTKTKPSFNQTTTAGGWYPYTPAAESQVIEFADARAVALSTRLRHRYWMTECQPLTWLDIDNQRRKMAGINPGDVLSDEEVRMLLTPAFGFVETDGAWSVPALSTARQDLLEASVRRKESASRAGLASAAKRFDHLPTPSPEPSADF